jgi:lipopolysaccharide biosynthesis protein
MNGGAKGFTEWTNVVRAKPLFQDHYQPHLPADLGFYDLRLSETREAQAELAKNHGISGFCYYHYWFQGRRLLGRPINDILRLGRPDFPFCQCWANESWTRGWLGEKCDVLISQTYDPQDDLRHGHWLARAFADPRYLRMKGRRYFSFIDLDICRNRGGSRTCCVMCALKMAMKIPT